MSEYTILAVDDEQDNLSIIESYLRTEGYKVVTAADGQIALDMCEAYNIDLVLADRMMPNMDGMELVNKMTHNPAHRDIPVIMQTALAQREQVIEGLKAGVYYYLKKPYDEATLLSIVSAAIRDIVEHKKLKGEVKKSNQILSLVERCDFAFNTMEHVRLLTVYLANFYPDPDKVSFGITAMLTNALEHGALGIGYDEKSRLNEEGIFEKEVQKRERDYVKSGKKIRIHYVRDDNEITLSIEDGGQGFDWQPFMAFDADRATDSHGRGIALARKLSFDEVAYQGNGNHVICVVRLHA